MSPAGPNLPWTRTRRVWRARHDVSSAVSRYRRGRNLTVLSVFTLPIVSRSAILAPLGLRPLLSSWDA